MPLILPLLFSGHPFEMLTGGASIEVAARFYFR